MTAAPLRLDHEETWPARLRILLDASLPGLIAYEKRRQEIDVLMAEDVCARINVPPNSYKGVHERMLQEIGSILAPLDIAGFHCTRLTTGERQDVARSGLLPLTPDLVERRVREALAEGHVTKGLADCLLAANDARDKYRAWQLWFAFTEAPLRDESGVGPLLGAWGGEALYRRHLGTEKAGAALMAVGEPCIVEAAVEVTSLARKQPKDVAGYLLRGFLRRRGIATGHGADMQDYTRSLLPARRILSLLGPADAHFAALTGYSQWTQWRL